MAITKSGLYVSNWIDILDTTQLALDLDLETHKLALYLDALTPNFSTDVSYSATSEASGTGYTAGGELLTTTVYTEAVTGSSVFDADDGSWPGSTIADAMAAIGYADALGSDNLIWLSDFVIAVSTTSGTLTVQWTAPGSGGAFNIDLTPA
jgi:hypothetical protein